MGQGRPVRLGLWLGLGRLLRQRHVQLGCTFLRYALRPIFWLLTTSPSGLQSVGVIDLSALYWAKDKDCILVVDDSSDMVAYLRSLLGVYCRILTATNGQEGLDIAIKHRPDLIISYVACLGSWAARHLMRELRADTPTANSATSRCRSWTASRS
jgi:hypothetical protein